MIAADAATSALVDAAVDLALARLAERARARSAALGRLADAAARAASGGKRFRPALVVASFDAFGGARDASPELAQVATAFELLHTGFVIHDDLIDRDTTRRGVLNVGGEYRTLAQRAGADDDGARVLGDAAAVLAGDLLLAEATRLIALTDGPARAELLDLFDDAILVSSAGELTDVEHAVGAALPAAADLLSTAHDKTAVYSFRAPIAAGALLAGADPAARRNAEEAASEIGLAFQLVDDLIGTFGSRQQAGREPGADLRERKRTPLVSLASQSPSWAQVDSALALAPTGPIALRRAQQALADSGARGRLVEVIDDALSSARRAADRSETPEPVRILLHRLADKVEGRIP